MKNVFQKRFRQTTAVLVALALVLSVLGPVGTVAAAPTVSVSQTVDSTTVNPGDTVTVTTTVSATDVNGPLLQYDLPDGWEGEVTDADGGFKKPTSGVSNTPEILWLGAGEYVVTLQVQVPTDAAEGDYDIVADLSAVDPLDDDDVVDEPYESTSATTTITVEEPVTTTPANFQVSNLNPTDVTVTQGDIIDVSATVENTGDEAGTQTVEFQVDGTPLADEEITLAGGESQTVTFENIDTGALAPDEYTHGVYTDDDSQTATLTVEEQPVAGISSAVSLSPVDAEVTIGDTQDYTVVVENADGGVGAYTATVTVDDPSVATITDVTLLGSPSASTTDVNTAADGSSVTITAALMNTDDTGSVPVAVVEVTGQAEGDADLSLSVPALGNEQGMSYTVTETNGASVSVVDLAPIGNFAESPNDINGDGIYEDTNGDGVFNIVDIQATFANMDDPVIQNNPEKFDYNGDGKFDVVDVQAQYNMLINGGA